MTTVGDRGTPRKAIAFVSGEPVEIECPEWCTSDHCENVGAWEDLEHLGESFSFNAPGYQGGSVAVLEARIVQRPNCSGWNAPQMILDVLDPVRTHGGTAGLTGVSALALADQMVAYGRQLQSVARDLSAASRVG